MTTKAKSTIRGLSDEHDPTPLMDEMSTVDEPQVTDPESSASDDDDYEFIRMPNGKVRAVPKSEIQDAPETSTQDAEVTVSQPKVVQHYYVHLADGSVERVKEDDLPTPAGTNAVMGYWQRDKKLYVVVGIYPVESNV